MYRTLTMSMAEASSSLSRGNRPNARSLVSPKAGYEPSADGEVAPAWLRVQPRHSAIRPLKTAWCNVCGGTASDAIGLHRLPFLRDPGTHHTTRAGGQHG